MACSIERAFMVTPTLVRVAAGSRKRHASVATLRSRRFVGGVPLSLVLRRGLPEALTHPLHGLFVGAEQGVAGVDVDVPERVALKLTRYVVAALLQHLVPGRLLRIGRQAVVLKGVAGQARDVLHSHVDDGVLRDGGVAVVHDPSLVEVGRPLLRDHLGYLIEGLGVAGGHGEDHGKLLLRQLSRVKGGRLAETGP